MSETARPLVSNSEVSAYVISITIPQPTIRIKIPKLFVKAMQRRNAVRTNNDDNGSKSKKSRKSFRKKVGSIFSSVFGSKKTSSPPETGCSNGENGEVHRNGDVEDQMEKLKDVAEESVEKDLVKVTRKSSIKSINPGVQEMAVATGFGVSKSLLAREMPEAGDEGEEGEKPKVTISKYHSKRTNRGGMKNAKINGSDDSVRNGASLSIFVAGDRGATTTVGTRSRRVTGKQEKSNELPKVPSKTVTTHRRKIKIAWSMKKMMGGEPEKQELCKKRILMGGRCRPLGTIQYDENGFLLPEI